MAAFPRKVIGNAPKDDRIDIGFLGSVILKDLLHKGLVGFALIVVFALGSSVDGDIDLGELALETFLFDVFGIADDVVHVRIRIKMGLEAYSINEAFIDGVLKETIKGPVAPSWLIVESKIVVIEFLPIGLVS